VYPELTDHFHYEEYGFDIKMPTFAYTSISFGATNSEFWEVSIIIGVNVFTLDPYRQTIWFSRFLQNSAEYNDSSFLVYIGAVYEFLIGKGGLLYCESAITNGNELFSWL